VDRGDQFQRGSGVGQRDRQRAALGHRHTKTTLVIREEDGGFQTYCHLGTGNYNPKTALLYTDLGLFTCDYDVGYDFINLFHYLTGFAPQQHYRKLIVAPHDMRRTFVRLIRREINHQREHGNGQIMAKMNALDDVGMIQELYRASEAGVQIDLVVRGHCRLRPGLPRYSENIRVISILGRFLEHTRIYYIHNTGNPRVLTGSADWQRRNLDERVEAILASETPELKERLIRTLKLALTDRRSAWDLQTDGTYVQRMPRTDDEVYGFQDILLHLAQDRKMQASAPWDIE
jgi:polyphosphate kinase